MRRSGSVPRSLLPRPGIDSVIENASLCPRFPREAVDLVAIGGEIARFRCRRVAGNGHDHRVVLAEMDIERHRESRLESIADTLAGLEHNAFLGRGVRRELEPEHRLGRLQPAGSGSATGRHGDPERRALNCAKSDAHLIARGLAAPAGDPPVFRQESPALMVPPAAGNLDVAAGVALAGEASAAHQRDRTCVRRLDVDLYTMQPQGAKSYAQNERKSFAHVALAAMSGESVIPEVGALKRTADNLAEVEYTDRRVVFSSANEHADVRCVPGVA